MNVRDRYDSLFQFYAERNRLDWRDLKAQAMAESGHDLDPDAVSPSGAVGLMQFMPTTWDEWADGKPGIQRLPEFPEVLVDPRDPEDAIRAGAAYMAWLLARPTVNRSWERALAAYNWGIGRIGRWAWQGGARTADLPEETKRYIARWQEYREELERG